MLKVETKKQDQQFSADMTLKISRSQLSVTPELPIQIIYYQLETRTKHHPSEVVTGCDLNVDDS